MRHRLSTAVDFVRTTSMRGLILLVIVTHTCCNVFAQHQTEPSSPPTPRSVGYQIEFQSRHADWSPEEALLPIRFAADDAGQYERDDARLRRDDFEDDLPSDIPDDGLQFDTFTRTADARSANSLNSLEGSPDDGLPFTEQTWRMGSAPEPTAMLEQINSELAASMNREMAQFNAIRDGLEQLRIHNQTLQANAESERQRATISRRQAKQSEQLAAEAKRSAEEANSVALETMSRVSQLEEELLQLSETPTIVMPTAPTNQADPIQQAIDPETSMPNADLARVAQGDPVASPPIESPATSPGPRRPTSKPITDSAVDRQALADSLFGAGEFRLAMQVYGQLVDNPPEGADTLWFKFQIAGCLRNLKEFEKAERYYRMVVGSKDELLGPTARWWLSNIEEQKLITAQVSRWDTFFQEQEGSQNEQNRQSS